MSTPRPLSLSNGAGATLDTRLPYRRARPEMTMSLFSEFQYTTEPAERLRRACAVTAEFLSEIMSQTCRRFPSAGQGNKTARIERLIRADAWTDVALALVDLELPQWQVRRIAYDESEWHCSLSRQRELPDWLDQSVEARHPDLALAILSAFVEAQRVNAPRSRPGVPAVKNDADARYEPVCSDNFS